jgi:hypothetical protein
MQQLHLQREFLPKLSAEKIVFIKGRREMVGILFFLQVWSPCLQSLFSEER